MNDEDTFKILLSTDNHLGCFEKDPIRCNDSFTTFEEILCVAESKKPDFILLGGDLFHENKPSVSSFFKCTELLRKYTFNTNPINFKIISDQSVNFSHSRYFKYSNFNDENLNVGMPIFTIHGNHDDPIDQSNLCALDIFHASGLVNLFGKTSSVETIEITPILMCKGKTKLALYGLGAIRNERLHRLFQQKKVTFLRPTESTDTWFSIFVIHQNRVKHGTTNYIPESFIPEFIDLVVWGHEHDCRINPEYNMVQKFYVSQPGSSVATSLSEGESLPKYIGVLQIHEKDFKIDKYCLQTVRPFVTSSLVLADEPDLCPDTDPKISQKIEQLCHDKIEELLDAVDAKLTGHSNQPVLPLVRLNIDYSGGFEPFSISRFSQYYVDRIANVRDLLVLHRKREQLEREQRTFSGSIDGHLVVPPSSLNTKPHQVGMEVGQVEDLVRQYFLRVKSVGSAGDQLLRLLNERELAVGVKLAQDKDNKDILGRVVEMQLERVNTHLKSKQVGETAITEEIRRFVDAFLATHDETRDHDDRDDDEEYIRQKLMLPQTKKSTTSLVQEPEITKKTTRAQRSTARKKQSDLVIDPDTQTTENNCTFDLGNPQESSRKRKIKSDLVDEKPVKPSRRK